MKLRVVGLLSSALLTCALAACGADEVVPSPDVDSGETDAGPRDASLDAGRRDAFECPDFDGDGYGAPPCGDDCDDHDPSRYPGATELCDYPTNRDEDCDPTSYGTKDDDGDGYTDYRCCNGGTCGTDCDDSRGGMHPGVPEVCNHRDDDCNGLVDDGDVQVEGYADADRDLYGAGPLIMGCAGPGLSAIGTDCSDTPPAGGSASPALREVSSDLIDNDCDGAVDESGGSPALWYLDADGDGFGVGAAVSSAVVLVGYALLVGDCDDTHAAINPAAIEVCNGLDDDCNGVADYDIGTNNSEDDDADGFVDTACGGVANDCDDGDSATHPGAVELCDGRDNDCDGVIDEGACAVGVDGGVPVDMGLRDSGPSDLGSLDLGAPDLGARDLGPVDLGAPTDGGLTGPTYLKASNTEASDSFGQSVSLSADGTRLAVGAYPEASNATGIGGNQADNSAVQSGAVYVFSRTGTTWTQEAYIKASNTEAGDLFGISVSLSADGTRLAVGAFGEASSAVGVGGNQADNTAAYSGAVYVFSRTGTTWTQEAYVKASNTGAGDRFGALVSLSTDGTRLAVGAYYEDSNATGVGGTQTDNSAADSGAVYVFSRTGATWTQEAYIKASNTEAGDFFGISVSLSADGTRLAVGAYPEDSSATGVGGNQADNSAVTSGAVYVFSRTGTTWTQEAYVKASNTEASDSFGHSVSLSWDGTRLAVGAWLEASNATGIGGNQADNSAAGSGAVYVFSRTGTTWTQEAYVKASNTGGFDRFGSSVSLSADGTRLAVDADLEASSATGIGGDQTDNSAAQSGAVYVFSRTGATWTQEAYVKASNTGMSDEFGFSVSLSGDGIRLAVGAYCEDSSATGIGGDQADNSATQSGAVYVY